jgi:transcription-repair coupling factor (superfamily II helicase)
LRALVPEARIAVGHGQMHSDQLEEVMTSFVNGQTTSCFPPRSSKAGWTFPTPTPSSLTEPTVSA